MVWSLRTEDSCFVGRTERQRVPAIPRTGHKPELAPLGPAYIHQTVAYETLVFHNARQMEAGRHGIQRELNFITDPQIERFAGEL